MHKPYVSVKRANALFSGLLLISMAFLLYIDQWWPGIMLAIGLPLALRQFLLAKFYDMTLSLAIFLAIFVTANFEVSWESLLPVLFTTAGLYIIFREFCENSVKTEEEEDEEINQELEEKDKL